MLKKSVLFVVFALTLAASTALAKGEMSFTVMGGIHSPTGDNSDVLKKGFLAGASGDYMVSENFAVGVNVFWSKNDFKDFSIVDDSTTPATLIAVTGDQTIIQGGAHAKFMIPMESSFRPYFIAGPGIYHGKASLKANGVDVPDEFLPSSSKVGGRIGAGVSFKAGEKMNVLVEGNYHIVNTEDEKTKFVTATAGLQFGFGSSK